MPIPLALAEEWAILASTPLLEATLTCITTVRAVDGPVDWVLVTTKGHQTAGAFPWLQCLARPDTPVVAVQNGVDHTRRLAPADLPGPVLPALAGRD